MAIQLGKMEQYMTREKAKPTPVELRCKTKIKSILEGLSDYHSLAELKYGPELNNSKKKSLLYRSISNTCDFFCKKENQQF